MACDSLGCGWGGSKLLQVYRIRAPWEPVKVDAQVPGWRGASAGPDGARGVGQGDDRDSLGGAGVEERWVGSRE